MSTIVARHVAKRQTLAPTTTALAAPITAHDARTKPILPCSIPPTSHRAVCLPLLVQPHAMNQVHLQLVPEKLHWLRISPALLSPHPHLVDHRQTQFLLVWRVRRQRGTPAKARGWIHRRHYTHLALPLSLHPCTRDRRISVLLPLAARARSQFTAAWCCTGIPQAEFSFSICFVRYPAQGGGWSLDLQGPPGGARPHADTPYHYCC